MSEPKRATLSTISTSKSDVKKVKETSKTIRFSLNLPESNEKSCPEYNYRDLLNSAEKKNKLKEKPKDHPNGFNNLDPFNDDDDSDVKRIAAKFEQKYGLPPTKKRRNKKDDYADIGAGYDESDSFIDNTDAYDEMVPEDVTTVHGGFYINSGALEFKTVELSGSESSDSEPEDKTEKSVNRKRIMEDSDETDSEEEKVEMKSDHIEKKQKIETNGVQKPAKKKMLLDDKDILIKKKKIDENVMKKKHITVKDLLREKREEFDMSVEQAVTEIDKVSEQKDLKLTTNTITDVIESVVNAGRTTAIVDEISKDNSSSDSVAVVTPTISDSECSRDGVPTTNSAKEPSQIDSVLPKNTEAEIIQMVKLPENLPTLVLEIINNIRKAAENSDEQVNLFTRPVNTMLFNLEIQCRKLSKLTRHNIYEFLAPFVKCQSSSLSRRAKNLAMHSDKDKALKKLKAIVDDTMPIVMKSYEKEFQKHRDEMFQMNANANAENGEANPKARRAPRKKYPWSDSARRALYDVILFKKEHFDLDLNREETFESMLDAFLKGSIIPLWPDGWMSFVALSKQVKSVLDIIQKTKIPVNAPPMTPISLDISATINSTQPFAHSPVMKLSPSSAITVIPIPPKSLASPKAAALNGPKKHHSPTIPTTTSVVKPTDMSVTAKKSDNPASVLSSNPEISIVTTNSKDQVPSSLLIPSNKSVSVTSVDLRTNQLKPITKEEEEIVVPVKTIIPVSKPKRIETPDDNDECQIIDLTDSPVVIRKSGPKSKTRLVDGLHHKHKRVKEIKIEDPLRRNEEISGTQALNQIITGLTRTSSGEVKTGYKETTAINEDEMEQVMKDLKELQQLQEHARKNEIDIMAPSSSPVSVIAFNSNYSTNSRQPSDLSTKDRKSTSADGIQELYQKHLYGDVLKSSNQSTSVYNSNVQPKNNFNSINNFSYSASGSISNPMNNIRYSQNPSKYTAPISHLPPTATGATNHTDDFALFQNFLYQYGFHNASGSKQKSPP